jgi:DNA-directed RNA polymerase subunit beta'
MNSIWLRCRIQGARPPQQMKQLRRMRGLMARPDGSIIETPIPVELQGRPHRAGVLPTPPTAPRKGLADTALKDGEFRLPPPPGGRGQ